MARTAVSLCIAIAIASFFMATAPALALIPYSRSFWDMNMMGMPGEDPFRILEQTPLTIPSKEILEQTPQLALARADWKETPEAHIFYLDVPGIKKEDVKIEVEENRVLRISGERKSDEEEKAVEGEKWHRAERISSGKFWRQFRLPWNADLDAVEAHLENGVLKIKVPKLAEEKKRQPKLVDIVEHKRNASGEDIKASKAELK